VQLVRLRILGKSPTNAYLRLNQQLWNKLFARRYGNYLHAVARIQSTQDNALIRRLVERHTTTDTLRREKYQRMLLSPIMMSLCPRTGSLTSFGQNNIVTSVAKLGSVTS
jgi:hypothetical protein